MPKDADTSGLTNPKRVIDRREAEAEGGQGGTDKGDLPGPAVDFFKSSKPHVWTPEDAKKLADALKKRS